MELIGFVGLGTIGGVVARNIQKGGYPMMVHDIRQEAGFCRASTKAVSTSIFPAAPRILFDALKTSFARGAHG